MCHLELLCKLVKLRLTLVATREIKKRVHSSRIMSSYYYTAKESDFFARCGEERAPGKNAPRLDNFLGRCGRREENVKYQNCLQMSVVKQEQLLGKRSSPNRGYKCKPESSSW